MFFVLNSARRLPISSYASNGSVTSLWHLVMIWKRLSRIPKVNAGTLPLWMVRDTESAILTSLRHAGAVGFVGEHRQVLRVF